MQFYRSVSAVTGAGGDGAIDWDAVATAAKAATPAGELSVSADERAAYSADVRTASDQVAAVTGIDFALPETIQIQHRHHWIDANLSTFERVMSPIEREVGHVPGPARVLNTGSMTVMTSFLARHVLGQYDPLLLADGDDHALYFVKPNIARVATTLDVSPARFRQWIAFHEVTHAAEFGAAPWLPSYLESALEDAVSDLSLGSIDRETFGELDTTMTAVEGYAELVMDRASDGEYTDIRRKLDRRRQGRGPLERLVRRLLGLSIKRRQYERGKRFFEAVVDDHGLPAASHVWDRPETLPTDDELDHPDRWVARVLD